MLSGDQGLPTEKKGRKKGKNNSTSLLMPHYGSICGDCQKTKPLKSTHLWRNLQSNPKMFFKKPTHNQAEVKSKSGSARRACSVPPHLPQSTCPPLPNSNRLPGQVNNYKFRRLELSSNGMFAPNGSACNSQERDCKEAAEETSQRRATLRKAAIPHLEKIFISE